MRLSRRGFGIAALLLPRVLRSTPEVFDEISGALKQLEAENGGRLGVALLNTGTGEQAGYRGHERFPMCSTFKFLLAAAVLERADRKRESLSRNIRIPAKPLLPTSPLTEPNAGANMTVESLCEAVITRSDNTAANLLLETIGGPAGLTRFARSIGDPITRLDRAELALNESRAGDPRDTTSPAAMVANLRRVLLGSMLTAASRDRLMRWMETNQTGLDRLRANLPKTWRIADKTGSNGEHTSNDIAVFWPPDRPPVIAAAYITQCPGPETKRASMLATIGALIERELTK